MAGRPTKLTDQLAAEITDGVRLGLELATVCDRTGISRDTLHRWRLRGARLRAQKLQGRLPRPGETERRLIAFSDAINAAEADAEHSRLATIRAAAEGGYVVTKRTTKRNAAGDVIETVVVEETLAPVWQAAAWFLERRLPTRYAKRLEVTGAEGTPLVPPEEQARGLADSLREFLAGAAAGAEIESERSSGNGR